MDFECFKKKYQKIEVLEQPNLVKSNPLVSICVQTYQHVGFLRDCLEGLLAQETTFPFEILLGDDDSTDGTREISLEYAVKYPDIIRLYLHHRENNIKIGGRPTGRFNFLFNLFSARGKYLAFCEGDDYWTDSLKLQKQVDFLERNVEYALCLHNVKEVNEFNSTYRIIPNIKKYTELSIEDYILNNSTATCSILLRRSKLGVLPEWFTQLSFGDLGIIIILLKNSNKKAKILVDTMGVYRIHEGGIHGSFYKSTNGLIKAYRQHLSFNKIISKNLLKGEYFEAVLKKKINVYSLLINEYKKQGKKYQELKSRLLKTYFEIYLKLKT